ncbi:MAG: hybrid sensor histidine kinase/response regulator [Rhodobacteraceae bacterium]|nr:hybrid sensor histidine kinase/response regulator [Paracoccaceae bacterium]MCF8513380.1 hybrid sensor histidine kinase/response regulator [Paracoccaceae bacterium]MCF8517720.1 hybrid sensor histidine kinase/response regulator [Paracoccaceae bacterium]
MIWTSSSLQQTPKIRAEAQLGIWSNDPLGQFRRQSVSNPVSLATVYVLSSLFFVFCLAFNGEVTDFITIRVANYSHISAPVLAVGLAILPYRFLWLIFGTFAASFISAELITVLWNGSTAWSALGMVRALLVAMTIGLISGGAARRALGTSDNGRTVRAPEVAALIGGIAFGVSGIVIGCFSTWIELHMLRTEIPFRMETVLFVQAQRELQLGIIAAGSILLFVRLPKLKSMPEILFFMAVFGVVGLLCRQGYTLMPSLDPLILALALLILRPIHSSIAAILGGFSLFIAISGCFVDLPKVMTVTEVHNDILTNILFGLMVLLAIQRMRSSRVERAQMQTLGRMTKAQELARFGYFLFDFSERFAYFDALAQKILGIPAIVASDDFLLRVHPDDRDSVSLGATTKDIEGQAFSFRFALDGAWTEGCDFQHFTGFARHERLRHKSHVSYGIVVDVSRERAQEEHMRMVLAELSEKQGQQTQIFSMISHELRTPASILSMVADELDDGKSWSEKGPQMRAVLDQLLAILTDMRQTVRPEQNLPVRIEAFRAQDLAESVRTAFHSMAQARGMSIELRMGAGAAALRCTDRVRLNQTLSNLVKNAIVHSQATEIVIRYEEASDLVGHWTVSDNGRNIPLVGRETIFHPFVRGDNSGARADGSGLGLYIAKEAIQLLGGRIDYVENPLSGAEFHIAIPLTLQPDGRDREASATAGADLERTVDLTDRSVLVVEDSETMGELLVARLQRVFGEVTWMRDGSTGMSWALAHSPDVVVTDLFMPGLSGDELILKLRAKGFAAPIIGMTATDFGQDVDRFRASGANDVFTKPVSVKTLEKALSRLL